MTFKQYKESSRLSRERKALVRSALRCCQFGVDALRLWGAGWTEISKNTILWVYHRKPVQIWKTELGGKRVRSCHQSVRRYAVRSLNDKDSQSHSWTLIGVI